VGGGAQSPLLCQATADAVGAPVVSGPVEATVAGNMLCQLLAIGAIGSLEDGRAIIRRSFEQRLFEPSGGEAQERAYAAFVALKAAD
jgi:rhamnulokinase